MRTVDEDEVPQTSSVGCCADCLLFCPFPWYVHGVEGYCKRPEVTHEQGAGTLFVGCAEQEGCLWMVPLESAASGDDQEGRDYLDDWER